MDVYRELKDLYFLLTHLFYLCIHEISTLQMFHNQHPLYRNIFWEILWQNYLKFWKCEDFIYDEAINRTLIHKYFFCSIKNCDKEFLFLIKCFSRYIFLNLWTNISRRSGLIVILAMMTCLLSSWLLIQKGFRWLASLTLLATLIIKILLKTHRLSFLNSGVMISLLLLAPKNLFVFLCKSVQKYMESADLTVQNWSNLLVKPFAKNLFWNFTTE